MQMHFDTSDSYVNILTVADFNLFSRAIQGDTHRFELIELFTKGLITWRISAQLEGWNFVAIT